MAFLLLHNYTDFIVHCNEFSKTSIYLEFMNLNTFVILYSIVKFLLPNYLI